MLEELFGSKTRIKVLKFLFGHPEEAFYVRELTRKIDSQINAVRRELMKLEKLNIVMVVDEPMEKRVEKVLWGKNKYKGKKKPKKTAKKDKKYYQINRNFIMYPELKALFLKSQLLVEKDLISRLAKIGRIYYLTLTGVFLGEGNSPTDLFMVGSVNKTKLSRLIKKVEKELETPINYTIMSRQEFKYRKDITDRFLYSILESRKIVVVDKLGEAKFEDERIKSLTARW